MNPRHIQYVLTILECGSFTAAANKLYIAQPSLSQSIISLEKSLGITIFNRSTSPITLTKAGELYVDAARKIQNIDDQFMQQINDLSHSLQGNVLVGTSQLFTIHIMPHILSKLFTDYPNINITLFELLGDEREKAALSGKLDLFFSYSISERDALEQVPVMNERILLALPPKHPLNDPKAVSAQKVKAEGLPSQPLYTLYNSVDSDDFPFFDVSLLKDEPFIMLPPYLSLGGITESLCQMNGFTPNVVLRTRSLDAMRSMVYAGLGCGFLPESIVRFGAFFNHPIYYQIGKSRALYLVYRKDRYLSRAASTFIDITREVIAATMPQHPL